LAFLADPEFWARWLGIVLIDLALAGDNALVIALAVRTLPRRQQFYGRIWGSLGAVALRLAFITAVSFLFMIPFLRFVGGLALIWIAVRLVREEGDGEHEIRHGASLWEAIWIIIVADVVMSLDNVLGVAAAAQGDMILVVFGISLSLPLVVWGSGLLARLMGRYPWIVWLGGGVLGYVAGEMMLKDPVVHGWLGGAARALEHAVPLALGLAMTALGWWYSRARASAGR
jgi:YjbE family integral membrane protein